MKKNKGIDRILIGAPLAIKIIIIGCISCASIVFVMFHFIRVKDPAFFIFGLIPIVFSAWFARYWVVMSLTIVFAAFALVLFRSFPETIVGSREIVINLVFYAVYLSIGLAACKMVKLYLALHAMSMSRRDIEEALEKERNWLHVTLLSIRDGLITADKNKKIIFMNLEAEKLTEWQAHDAMGRHINEVYTILNERTREKIEHPVQRIIERGYVIGLANHTLLVSKSGKEIPIGDSGALIREKTGTIIGYIIVFRDVSQNKVTQQKLKEAQAKVMQFEKLAGIGQLAAGIAHEINNPLGYINSNLDTLGEYVTSLKKIIELYKSGTDKNIIAEEEQRLKIDSIIGDVGPLLADNKEGIQKISGIVKNLKNFARTNPDGQWEKSNINTIVHTVLAVLASELVYGAFVDLDLADDIPELYCNVGEINQVFLNILLNALHAIRKKFPMGKGTIAIRTGFENGHVICTIRDNGIGIPNDIMMKIFEPFFTTKSPNEGTGLGLYISYDIIVLRHKGDISVKSEEGIETSFEIKLPLNGTGTV